MDKYSGTVTQNTYNAAQTGYCDSQWRSSPLVSASSYPAYTVSSSSDGMLHVDTPDSFIEEFMKENPIFWPIANCKIIGNKAIIKVKNFYTKNKDGNIYIPEADLYGAYSEEDILYWKNIVLVEFERNLTNQELKPGMHFMFAPQWDNNLTLDDIKDLFKDEVKYYKYIHAQLQKKLGNANSLKAHKDLDTKLGLDPEYLKL